MGRQTDDAETQTDDGLRTMDKGQTDVEMEVEIVFRTKHVCYIIKL
jgi:hypothetical protein